MVQTFSASPLNLTVTNNQCNHKNPCNQRFRRFSDRIARRAGWQLPSKKSEPQINQITLINYDFKIIRFLLPLVNNQCNHINPCNLWFRRFSDRIARRPGWQLPTKKSEPQINQITLINYDFVIKNIISISEQSV